MSDHHLLRRGAFLGALMAAWPLAPVLAAFCGGLMAGGGAPPPPPASSFFVSPSGSDTNSGLSRTTAVQTPETCRSLMQAQLSTGIKTCTLMTGTFNRTATLLLTVTDNGETWQYDAASGIGTAILDGGGTVQTLILINGGSNITINGLQFQNAVSAGVGVHGGPAVCGYAGNWTAAGTANANTITQIIAHNITPDPANVFFNGGVIIQGQATNTVISNSVMYSMTDNGMRAGANDDGCTPADTISGTQFVGNVVYGVGGAGNETACYYMQDTTSNSTGIVFKNNWGRDCGTGTSDQKRGLYRDEGLSSSTSTGNVIITVAAGGAAYSGGGDTANFISSGHNDGITGNLFDLGPTSKTVTLSYLQSNTALASTGNNFSGNVVVGSWAGTQNTAQFGATGVSLIEGCSSCGTFTAPTVTVNDWYNYGGGSLPSTGNAFNDASPHTINPAITGTCENPQFGPAIMGIGTGIGIPQLPTSFGYPGYAGPPAKGCSWSAS